MMRNWMRAMVSGVMGAAVLVGLTGCGANGLPTGPKLGNADRVELVRRGPGGVTRFMARNVVYRLDKNVSMFLEDMNTSIILKDPTLPFVPANKNEFTIQIHQAKVSKDAKSLAALMNTYVFNDEESPLRNIKIAFKGDRIVMGGEMKKGVWVGFEMEGELAPTPDGKIVLTPKVIKSMGMRVDGLMGLFGLEMAKLLKMKEEKGLVLQGNQIIMDCSKLFPPPTLSGRVTKASISNNLLHLEFNDGRAKPWPELPLKTQACVAMWGGDVLINTNLVLNAKILQVDATPNDPMVFALDFYREQLEAGYVVSTKSGHMITYVPDIDTYTPNLGRYAPPGYPIPGMIDLPSDMNQTEDEAGAEESRQEVRAKARVFARR